MPTVVHQQREENYVAILLASAVDSVSYRRHPWAAKNPFPVLLERRRFEPRTQHFHILFHTAAAVLLAYCTRRGPCCRKMSSVDTCVCLSVCHAPVLCQFHRKYSRIFRRVVVQHFRFIETKLRYEISTDSHLGALGLYKIGIQVTVSK